MNKQAISKLAEASDAQLSELKNSITLTVKPEGVLSLCKLILKEFPELYHLSTITAIDEGENISVQYHFWYEKGFLTIRTSVLKTNSELKTISDLIPGALLYEAEVKDLLGVVFDGNPFMDRKLLLPDNYPIDAPPPLRKEADPAKIRRAMGLE